MNVDLPQPFAPIRPYRFPPPNFTDTSEKRGLAPNCMAILEATITRGPGNKKAGRGQLWMGPTARADYSKVATLVHSPTLSGITPASVRDRLVDELLHLLAEVGALRARRLRH